MQGLSRIITVLALVVATGCGAHGPTPREYRYADLVHAPQSGRHIFDQPIILEFAVGDRLPVELGFRDALFALDPAAPDLALIAKEHCFIRIDGHGIRSSPNRTDFDQKPERPGAFFLGFAHRARGPALNVQIQTPRRH